MVELGGMLAAAILKVVSDQIASAIGTQIKLHKNFTKDLEKMKMALESVEALLQDAERRSIEDKPTRLWLRRLKVAMYAISDMIDEFEADTEAFTQPSARKFSLKQHLAVLFQPCLTIVPRSKLANEMKTMREDLKNITDQHKDFNFLAGTNASELNVRDERETMSSIDVQIFGRNEERDRILAYLSQISITRDCSVLAIYGIGGLGKTTLAQMVYNSSQYRDHSRVWVYVSQTFDLMKIGNSIISQLSKEQLAPYSTLQMVQNTLLELLAGKKILIVLDDLWELKEDWKKLMAMLHGEGSNVIAIITTRSEDIAVEVSTNNQPHKLALLENEVCWSIIKQKSDFESKPNREELKDIGMSIARKCGGVALAAQSLGFVLKTMNTRQWRSMMESDIWSPSDSEDPKLTNVFKSLMLSYSAMPKYLKLCLAYCAIFPKGHQIVKGDLIQQWISLSFIKPTNVSSSWDIGEGYIRQLLGLSFLQDSKSSLVGRVHLEDATLFTMHDLVHDLARLVMFDEIIVAGEDINNEGSCSRYALLNDCSKPLGSPKIRALRFMDCGEIELDGAAFSSAKSLRVLDLSECYIHKLPDSIGVLKQLRYLNAPRVQHEIIPDSITKLSKLTYLNLHGSLAISALPESIGDIEGLLYFDLSGCSGIEKLPESLGRLAKLVHLDLSNCSRIGDISKFLGSLRELQYLNLSHCPNIGWLPKELGGLSKLQYLNLSFSSYLQFCREAEVLGTLTKLKYLNLSSSPDVFSTVPKALGCLKELEYLNLSGFKDLEELPTVIGNLRELRYLNLSWCLSSIFMYRIMETYGEEGSFIKSISALSNLEHLDLSNNFHLRCIPACFCNLRKLHTLDLSNCRSLKEIPESIRTIDCLKFLYADHLSEPPQLGSNVISLPNFVVNAGDGGSRSNLFLLQHADPVKLHITRLENVKTEEEAQRIELIGKQSMNELELNWTSDAERFVDDEILLEKLVPPSTLIFLEIQGYNCVSFPAWLMDMAHYLPNLVKIEMCGLPKCHSLPPVDQVPKLKYLILRDMASLEEWNTSYTGSQVCTFESVEIYYCPKLRIKPLPPRAERFKVSNSDSVLSSWGEYTGASTSSYPVKTTLHVEHCEVPMHQWRLLQHLPGLTRLKITGCRDLSCSPDIIQHLSFVEALELNDRDQEELPKWLGELTSLKELEISSCSRLKELHERMRLLTMLQTLKLADCNSIASLPHWLGELTSLKTLQMCNCAIWSLPEVIQQLTNLQELKIDFCSELKWWCVSEENNTKLTSNQERACVLPTSLKKLVIFCCGAISSLPEGIKQLTNLQKLEINFCSELKWWSESEEIKTKLTPNQERACVLPTSLEELTIIECGAISSLPDGIQQLTNLQKLVIRRCPALKKWCELEENKTKLAHIQNKDFFPDLELYGDLFYSLRIKIGSSLSKHVHGKALLQVQTRPTLATGNHW